MSIPHTHLTTSHSTNSQLIDWILASATSNTATNSDKNSPHFSHTHFSQPHLLTADTQTSGRGQHGRQWHSPLGNVYLSLYIPTAEFAEDKNFALNQRLDGRLSLCVSYQLSQIPQIAGIEKIGVKWVNDIGFYHNEQFNKLAGILIEPVSVDNNMLGVVIGVGMNITHTPNLPNQPQTGLNYKAVSLQDLTQKNLQAKDFYPSIDHAILQAIEQFNSFYQPSNVAEFLQNFQQVDILLGKTLQISLPTSDTIIGTAHGIDGNGCLQILPPDGKLMPIWTGTIQVLKGL